VVLRVPGGSGAVTYTSRVRFGGLSTSIKSQRSIPLNDFKLTDQGGNLFRAYLQQSLTLSTALLSQSLLALSLAGHSQHSSGGPTRSRCATGTIAGNCKHFQAPRSQVSTASVHAGLSYDRHRACSVSRHMMLFIRC